MDWLASRVYFAQDPATGLIKVGCSRQLEGRLRNLRHKHPGLVLLASAPGGRGAEGALHRKIETHHVGHEWFQADPLVTALAIAVREGWLRPADLPRTPSPLRSAASKRAYETRRTRLAAKPSSPSKQEAA